MTIGFDLTWMSRENQFGGVFQYAMRLLQALTTYSDNRVIAIINADCEPLFSHLSGYANFRLVKLPQLSSLCPYIEQEKIDVIHTPLQILPNITLSVPMITTLHDLQPFHFPEFFSSEEIAYRNVFYRRSAEFGERVIASFAHVKDDIVKFYNIPHGKIDVCTMGMPEKSCLTPEQVEVVKKKYELPELYVLYAANTWRHKNHIGLLRGIKLLHEKHGIRIPLICTGFQVPDVFPEIEAFVASQGLAGIVRFMGYLPEADMPAILSGAALAVIPTLYEAGSYPLMEAMAQGVPVVCSRTTSLPDTIGDNRFVFDPNSPEDIAEKIALILSDEKLCRENIENSLKKVQEGSWATAVKVFESSYRKAIEGFSEKKKQIWFKDWAANYEFLVNQKYAQTISECNRLSGELMNLRNSFEASMSWRITKLLRVVGDWIWQWRK